VQSALNPVSSGLFASIVLICFTIEPIYSSVVLFLISTCIVYFVFELNPVYSNVSVEFVFSPLYSPFK